MLSAIEVAGISPSSSSFLTRAAFAPPAPGATRYPASSLVFSPPTPRPLRPRLWFPSPLAYLVCALVLGHIASAPHELTVCAGDWSPAPRYSAGIFEEKRGSPRFLDHPLVRAASKHHAGCDSPSPCAGAPPWPSGTATPWAPGKFGVFGADLTRLTRSQCLRIAAPRRRRASQGSLPSGWAKPSRAGISPAG